MKIRSITFFTPFYSEAIFSTIKECADIAKTLRKNIEAGGVDVQTIRLATSSFTPFLVKNKRAETLHHIAEIEKLAIEQGFDYLAIGPALINVPESYQLIPDILHGTKNVFSSAIIADQAHGICPQAVLDAATIIERCAPLEENGFANLRFAALANVQPYGPFFPSAFHDGSQQCGFAIAIEAADEVLQAFSTANSLEIARSNLLIRLSQITSSIEALMDSSRLSGILKFHGFDISVAPYPSDDISLGNALESLGVPALGYHGSLAAAAFLADSLDRGLWHKTGFNGLMLPLLEDSRLAQRSIQGILSVKDLLMYSAVCGTGLDTIPLAGDVSATRMAALLLDVAALSMRLNKPLTARLMPVPGKKAGDLTTFDFSFFANGRILELQAEPLENLFARTDNCFSIKPRPVN